MSNEVYAPPPGPPPVLPDSVYTPPHGPPPTHWYPPPLQPASLPLLSAAQTHSLSTLGYTTLPISDRPSLHEAAASLFEISRNFFAQPQPDKSQFQIRSDNAQGSEEGWSRVPGEKELLTVRRAGITCPPSVENEARVLWRECGVLMQEMTRGVEQSLGMPHGALDGVVSPECAMPEDGADRHETLLRMFRYLRRSEADDRAASHDRKDNGKGRLVSESHRDLGILSLVIGLSPGLEVWDTSTAKWIPIEEPPHAAGPGLTATLLVGETLTRLTNSRYAPGRHRVFVPSAPAHLTSPDDQAQFRYSLVFALRPHANAILSTAALTTPITGVFADPLEGVRARDLFAAIARTHWNVNTAHQVRDAQRLRLQAGKGSENGREITDSREAKDTPNGEKPPKGKDHKKRWSLPSFTSSPIPPEDNPEPRRRNRWSFFQRISRR